MNVKTNRPDQRSEPTLSFSDAASHVNMSLPENSEAPAKSSFQKASPILGRNQFLFVMALLMILPVGTVALIGLFLPPVQEGTLEAKVQPVGLPDPEFYQIKYSARPEFEGGFLLVTNTGEEEWTNFEITLNTFYQIYDYKPIKPGETVSFNLNRFISKMGAKFSLRYNEVRYVRIYARLPSKKRATYYQKFDTVAEGTRN